MLRSFFFVAVALVGSLAGAQSLAGKSQPIRAAIGLLESDRTAGVSSNYVPHVWFNLDQNRRVKPAALEFTNPLHETQFTVPVHTRWTALGGSPGLNSLVQKRHAPYWEVPLSTASDAQLGSLDVMLIAAYGNVILNPAERARLTRFVERGGVLWIDTATSTVLDPINNFPLPFRLLGVASGVSQGDFSQPLLTYPREVTGNDLELMQNGGRSAQPTDLAAVGLGALTPILSNLGVDTRRFLSVVEDGSGPWMLQAQMGQGYVVLTTRAVARALNEIPVSANSLTTNFDPNNTATALPFISSRRGDAAAKLAINLVYLTSGSAQAGGGNRRTGSTPIDVGSPAIKRFADDRVGFAPSSPNGYRPPVVFKGMMIIASDDRVYVYDANPRQDLDGDGNPDDGIVDFANGTSYDLIWYSESLAGPISSPSAGDVALASQAAPYLNDPGMTSQIWVQDGAGVVHAWPLQPYDANGRLIAGVDVAADYSVNPSGGAASFDAGQPDAGPYAPTYHEGYLFVGDVQDLGLNKSGRLWVINPATGRQVTTGPNGWTLGGSAATVMPDHSTPLTVGYIPIADNSGGVDRVVYAAGRPVPGPGSQTTASLNSFWFGSKGERPTAWVVTGGNLEITTRAASQGLDVYIPTAVNDDPGLGFRITLVKPNGDVYTPAEMTALFTGTVTQASGVVRLQLNGAATIPIDTGVRVDYTLDWGTGSPSVVNQILRGSINFPDDNNRIRRILHRIALSPQGTCHLVVSSQNESNSPGGSYFAVKEEGRGNFKVLNRFDLFNPHQVQVNGAQATTVSYRETFVNNDPLITLAPPGLGGQIRNQTFMSGPTIRDGLVLVTAQGRGGFFNLVPYSIVMAFRAEPEPMRIRAANLQNGFSLLQPDIARSNPLLPNGSSVPETYNVLQPGQYTYEDTGNGRGVIVIDSLSGTGRGPITNCLSTSQAVILRQNGQTDVLLEPAGVAGNNWSQLQWYTVFIGVQHKSPVFVSGNSLFVVGESSWRNILNSGFTNFTPSAQIFSMTTDIAPNNSFLGDDPLRTWQRQLFHLRVGGSGIDPNPAINMPGFKGITSFDDYRLRLEQTILLDSAGADTPNGHGVVGGDGGVFAWADSGIFAFSRAQFLVADSNRISRLDSEGSPIWSISGTLRTGQLSDSGAAGDVKPFARISRSRPINEREMLISDAGANRVVRIDDTGREIRSIEGFGLDANYQAPGYTTGGPRTLSGPRDAITFQTIVPAANNSLTSPAPVELWRHYLIADTGNRRLIEVVDRYAYDVNTRRVGNAIALGTLYWHSPSRVSGGRYGYSSVDRVFVEDGANSRWVYGAGIGDPVPTRVDLGLDAPTASTVASSSTGDGGIVIFDGANSIVVNEVEVPAIGPNVQFNEAGTAVLGAEGARVKRLRGLNSISLQSTNAGGGSLTIMFTDNEGVFEVTGALTPGAPFTTQWMLNRQAYRSMRRDNLNNVLDDNPDDFRPSYARRLESGEVLVCNGWVGHYRRPNLAAARVPFTGEVLLLDGNVNSDPNALGFDFNKLNFGFRTLSIRALLNNKPGANLDTRGIVNPVFADKQ